MNALMIGCAFKAHENHDTIVKHAIKIFQRISEMQAFYMPLQYPLLFPYGEDGWNDKFFNILGFVVHVCLTF